MDNSGKRGSAKLMAAWNTRALSEESVREIAVALDKSPAAVEGGRVVGGANATGVTVSLSYSGDDIPYCGNDIFFWLKWHMTHGGLTLPPRIIINGTPYPDLIHVDLHFGNVGQPGG